MIPYSPLAGGVLSGKYRKWQPSPESVRAQENADNRFHDQNFKITEKVVEVAHNHSISAPAVAIYWSRAKPCVSAQIVGANYPEQLFGVLDGLDANLNTDDLAALDEVSDFRRSRTTLERL